MKALLVLIALLLVSGLAIAQERDDSTKYIDDGFRFYLVTPESIKAQDEYLASNRDNILIIPLWTDKDAGSRFMEFLAYMKIYTSEIVENKLQNVKTKEAIEEDDFK